MKSLRPLLGILALAALLAARAVPDETGGLVLTAAGGIASSDAHWLPARVLSPCSGFRP